MPAPLARLVQARDLFEQGRHEAALAVLQHLVRGHADDPDVNSMLCVALCRTGRYEQAAYYGVRAAALSPGDAYVALNAALALEGAGRAGEAILLLEGAVARSPDDVPARLELANLLLDTHRADAAAEHCRAALARGENPQVAISLAGALLALTEISEGVAVLRRAIASHPEDADLAGALASALNYATETDPAEIARAHHEYGRLVERAGAPGPPPRRRSPGAPLRVGFVSPDFRAHSVAYFIEPLVEHLDRARFETLGYFVSVHADAVTGRLRRTFDLWRDCGGIPPGDIASRISADRPDILIDLAGHTLGSALLVMSLRPAPVQATFLGYPNTTGLTRVDYRLVDSRTDPGPGADALCTEKLVRLDPCFLCYRPPPGAPAPARAQGGPFTFGSFNASQKINAPLLGLWARVLHAVPGSRLALKALGFADAGVTRRIAERLAAHGIDPSRVEFLPPAASTADHLARYGGIDAALDTYPYHGTTTTCEALWMGVPVVTLAGPAHAQRVGVTLLHAAGLPDLVASDEREYVALAAALAGDVPRRQALRHTLRETVARSVLCDERGYAARFGAALEAMAATGGSETPPVSGS